MPDNVHCWHLPKNGLRDPTWLWRLISVVRQCEPDIVHGWLNSASHWANLAARAADNPAVVTSEMTLRESAARLMVHRLGQAAVADSQAVFERLPKRQRVLIRPGVPARQDGPIAALRGRVVLSVGSLHPDKGTDVLIEHARHSDDHVVLVGPSIDPAFADSLRATAPDNVTFVGAVADVTPYLRAAHVFVLPSRTESCPNALLEAMSYGLPIVATRVGDVPLLLEQYGGQLVAPDDRPALSAAIAAADKKPGPQPDSRHGVSAMVEQYTALYRRLL